ncbi:serine hydrolase [Agromyces sp. CFH 90414]|uniref:Serine hydrolase n=1 Tax=Agromyces agglutinans TaxID=2662258 RepID=A0A6I2F9M7_9MICO|nr:serine hydrolase domain-containing protein [Agromyces agglutinans]MRG58713.1 serine hydrolase [Agromyces agglutinans]
MTTRLPRSTPSATGLDPAAIERLLAGLDRLSHPHAVMVLHRGSVVAEAAWAPYELESPHLTFSVSKSFTATAIGFAIDEGLLALDDRVVDLLPDAAPEQPSANLSAMRLRHLLTMTTGHAADSMPAVDDDGSWAGALLAVPVEHEPGSRFVYDTGATYLLSAILRRVTGTGLLEFLGPRLFEPLGIDGARWERDPEGIEVGGFGLSVSIEAMAKLGELYRLRGRWGDRRLLSEAWVDAATAAQVPNGPTDGGDWAEGYGFQFWRCRYGAYRADGAFGQFIVVWPERELVVAITAGIADMREELEVVWDAFGATARERSAVDDRDGGDGGDGGDGDGSGSGDGGAADATRLGPGRVLPWDDGLAESPLEAEVLGVEYAVDAAGAADAADPADLADPAFGLECVAIRRDDDGRLVLRLDRAGTSTEVVAGNREWVTGALRMGPFPEPEPIAASAAWVGDHVLLVRIHSLETPFAWSIEVSFAADASSVRLVVDQNVSFDDPRRFRGTLRAVPARTR